MVLRVLGLLCVALVIASAVVAAGVWLAHDARSLFLGIALGVVLALLASRFIDALVVLCWGNALATYYHSGQARRER